MSNVINFPTPAPADDWLCTVELYRRKDGEIFARLADMPAEVIEEMGNPSDQMVRLSLWMGKGATSFREQAVALSEDRP